MWRPSGGRRCGRYPWLECMYLLLCTFPRLPPQQQFKPPSLTLQSWHSYLKWRFAETFFLSSNSNDSSSSFIHTSLQYHINWWKFSSFQSFQTQLCTYTCRLITVILEHPKLYLRALNCVDSKSLACYLLVFHTSQPYRRLGCKIMQTWYKSPNFCLLHVHYEISNSYM